MTQQQSPDPEAAEGLRPAPRILELGHTGLWVNDLETMRDFYSRVLGLTITDEDTQEGIVFLSSRPAYEHHEFVLNRGRVGGPETRVTHQISWRLRSLEDLKTFHTRLVNEGVPIQQVVTHGNAFGIYFFDPEGNRNEVYWPTGEEVAQPFRKSLDLDQDDQAVLGQAERLLREGGPAYQPVRDWTVPKS